MAGWLTTADAELVADLGFIDADNMNPVVLGVLLDAAREACEAFAPDLPLVGDIIPGPVTLHRRNLFPNPSFEAGVAGWTGANISRVAGGVNGAWCLRRGFTSTAAAAIMGPLVPATPGETVAVSLTAKTSNRPFRLRLSWYLAGVKVGEGLASAFVTPLDWAPVAGSLIAPDGVDGYRLEVVASSGAAGDELFIDALTTAPGAYFDGSTPPEVRDGRIYSHAWEGAEHASASVETYRPDVYVPSVPDSYRLAQAMQARSLFNAGATGPSGALDGSEYGATAFPLDWNVRQLLRPRRGVGAIL